MNSIFSQSKYIIKRQGLSIAGKYKVFGPDGKEMLLYVEEKSKWIPPSITIHIYTDEKKSQEVLTIKDQLSSGAEGMDVFDTESGQKIGCLISEGETFSELFKDVWTFLDPEGNPFGKIYEKSLSKSLLRELVTHDLPQQMDIKIGDIEVGELRQKIRPISYELTVDLTKDVSALLDCRLAIAAAIVVARHQGNETD
jgi:hypothetical protein